MDLSDFIQFEAAAWIFIHRNAQCARVIPSQKMFVIRLNRLGWYLSKIKAAIGDMSWKQ